MMKGLKLWQKAGLVAAIVGGLTLGGLTPNYSSKGLESKLPTIGISVAEAKETNPNGYGVPDLTGKTPYKTVCDEDEGLTFKMEKFAYVNGQHVIRLSRDGKVFAYIIDENMDKKADYAIVDEEGIKNSYGRQTFETKYDFSKGEKFPIPNWAR